jgi:hypothetical protein
MTVPSSLFFFIEKKITTESEERVVPLKQLFTLVSMKQGQQTKKKSCKLWCEKIKITNRKKSVLFRIMIVLMDLNELHQIVVVENFFFSSFSVHFIVHCI